MAQEVTESTATPATAPELAKSKGHIGFNANFEYFWAANGDLYRAPKHNPVFPDGYRCGRFESNKHVAPYFLSMVGLGEVE